jgi:hypothetical protein
MLYNFINEVCPRGFDFLYLRMDFKARLNVGYAFINFLSVENVLKFAKSKLGVKWGVFCKHNAYQVGPRRTADNHEWIVSSSI